MSGFSWHPLSSLNFTLGLDQALVHVTFPSRACKGQRRGHFRCQAVDQPPNGPNGMAPLLIELPPIRFSVTPPRARTYPQTRVKDARSILNTRGGAMGGRG